MSNSHPVQNHLPNQPSPNHSLHRTAPGVGELGVVRRRYALLVTTMYSDFTIEPTSNWFDIADDVPGDDVPLTFGRPDGFGALQFSIASYQSGPTPNPSTDTLHALLRDFAQSRELGAATDLYTEVEPLLLAAASFRTDSFIRVWYLSDGRSFALATFTCDIEHVSDELPDCEQMVRTLSFQ